MKIVKRISEGQLSPKWYGLVERDYKTGQIIVAVFPLNWVLRLSDVVYFWLMGKFARRTARERYENKVWDACWKEARRTYLPRIELYESMFMPVGTEREI